MVALAYHGDPEQIVVRDHPVASRRQLDHDARVAGREAIPPLHLRSDPGPDTPNGAGSRLDLSAADELGERLAAVRGCADAWPEKSDRSASSERGKRPVGNVIDDDDTRLGARVQPSAGGAGRNESDGHCREDTKREQET